MNSSQKRCGSFSPKAILVLPKYVINFVFYCRRALYILAAMNINVILGFFSNVALFGASHHPSVYLIIYGSRIRSSMLDFSGLPYLQGVFHRALLLFFYLIFLSTESSSSWVNGPTLISDCLLIILVIGSWVPFGGFPSKFSKCCFQMCTPLWMKSKA